VDEVLASRQVFQVVPMDVGDGDEDDSFPAVDPDKIKSQYYVSLCLPIEDRIVLERLMGMLRDLERSAIHLFFYQDLSQTEIARKLNISCNYAGHLIRTGLNKLRRQIQSEELREAHLLARRPGEKRTVIVDRVTSLYSDSYFPIRLEEEIARARYYRRNLAVVAVSVALPADVGPTVRDDLLAECGIAIRQCLRRADIPARVGACQFGVILPHTSYQAVLVAERLGDLVGRVTKAPTEWGAAVWPAQGAGAVELWACAQRSIGALHNETSPSCLTSNDVPTSFWDTDNSERTTGQVVGERRGRGRPRKL
jgi:RNA polymerase sigma-B factor